MARIDDKNLVSYLEKATEAALKLEHTRSMSAADPQEAIEAMTTLRQFDDELCKPLAASLDTFVMRLPEVVQAVGALSPEAAEATARASAALGLAADYCEHAAETLERARLLAVGSANRLSKEVPAEMASMRGEWQRKAKPKLDSKGTSAGRYSLHTWLKKESKAEPINEQAGSPTSNEAPEGAVKEKETIKKVSSCLLFTCGTASYE